MPALTLHHGDSSLVCSTVRAILFWPALCGFRLFPFLLTPSLPLALIPRACAAGDLHVQRLALPTRTSCTHDIHAHSPFQS
ncbi:hypothetical protein HZ326_18557 [Fusarium oxysporum f. sp. albedinis]|nr:hypothetical protein HZ326_18557 [Fusarium oxysporum f. sp. albedinis]